MSVGDCQAAFGVAAARDGLRLRSGSVPSLTDAGHLAVHPEASFLPLLKQIFERLGGDESELRLGSHRPLAIDWLADEAKLVIEVDEAQHFTSDRLVSLNIYPRDAPIAFSLAEYKTLCEVLRGGSDRYRADKEARGFRRPGGRRAQRAYFDAVRDLAAPDAGWRVFRVPAGHNDGDLAYREVRKSLMALL